MLDSGVSGPRITHTSPRVFTIEISQNLIISERDNLADSLLLRIGRFLVQSACQPTGTVTASCRYASLAQIGIGRLRQ
jgi:hypothetical protein